MHVLFEEAGKFMAGRVLSEAEASSQVELDSGKRVKVKAANILLKFESRPRRAAGPGRRRGQTIELELAWEFAPEGEFGFADLARDYFSANATLAQQAGALFRLFEAPHYFRRAGKGRFKKAPAEILQQALAAIEKKKVMPAADHRLGRRAGRRPLPGADPRAALQDPVQARQERARVQGRGRGRARHPALPPLDLLQKAGAIDSPYQFHWKRFLFENFPQGHRLPGAGGAAHQGRPAAGRRAGLSIDDSQTTEIDDALSVQGLGSGTVVWASTSPRRAWPSARQRIDQLGRQRLSTVYMPGYKITMLPDDVVQTYTLRKGATARPCRCTSRWTRPRWRSRPPRPGWSACPSPPTCATTSSTAWSPKARWIPALSIKMPTSPAPIA
jgi:exoribonuclease-2